MNVLRLGDPVYTPYSVPIPSPDGAERRHVVGTVAALDVDMGTARGVAVATPLCPDPVVISYCELWRNP